MKICGLSWAVLAELVLATGATPIKAREANTIIEVEFKAAELVNDEVKANHLASIDTTSHTSGAIDDEVKAEGYLAPGSDTFWEAAQVQRNEVETNKNRPLRSVWIVPEIQILVSEYAHKAYSLVPNESRIHTITVS